jgi:hypothetical protein
MPESYMLHGRQDPNDKQTAKHFLLHALLQDPKHSVRDLEAMMTKGDLAFAAKKSCISNYFSEMPIRRAGTIKATAVRDTYRAPTTVRGRNRL